jgi:small subunit ribosomal protein S16
MKQGLVCKLCRFGKKRQPVFRFGVMPKFRSPNKKFALEFIGFYNPITKDFKINKDRLDFYTNLGMSLTDSVKGILVKNNILPKDKVTDKSTKTLAKVASKSKKTK